MRYLDAFAGHMLIAKPLASIVTEVDIAPENIQSMREMLTAFSTFFVVLAEMKLVSKRVPLVLEDLKLVFELFYI